jgi:hypothetical protein
MRAGMLIHQRSAPMSFICIKNEATNSTRCPFCTSSFVVAPNEDAAA